jgi:hypothetical protein
MCPVWANRVARAVAALGVIGACSNQPTATSGGRVAAAPADQQQLLAYAQNQQFWTRLGAADRAIIDDNVDVIIEPEANNFKLTRQELSAGRIVARFIKTSGGEVRRLGLLDKDTVSYWTVSQQGNDYVGRFVSASFDTSYAIAIDWHDSTSKGLVPSEPNLPWTMSIAQWRFDIPAGGGTPFALVADKGTGWATCTAWGCCRTH